MSVFVHPRWEDGMGKPSVTVWGDEPFVRWIWASLTVELFNSGERPVLVREIVLEIRTESRLRKVPILGSRQRGRLLAEAYAREVDGADRSAVATVDWVLPAQPNPVKHHIVFSREYAKGHRATPPDPKRFHAFVVAKIGPTKRPVACEFDFDAYPS